MNSKIRKSSLIVLLTITFIICSTLILTISFNSNKSNKVYAEEPSAASSFAGGTGTSDDPYLISSPEELIKFRDIVNGTNGETQDLNICAKLTQDIVFRGTNNWSTPIAVTGGWNDPSTGFQGVFDGDGYAIIGLNQTYDVSQSYNYLSLFGYLGGSSELKNLTLRSGEFIHPGKLISNGITSGTLAGFFYSLISTSTASITNCHAIDFNLTNLGNSSSSSHTASIGINSYSGSSITKCSSSGEIVAASGRVGGIMAFVNSSTVQDCYSTCNMEITGDGQIGGIVGFSSSHQSTLTIQRNHYYGTITYDSTTTVGTYNYVGGITSEATNDNTVNFISNYYLASSIYAGVGRNTADASGKTEAISVNNFKNTSTFSGWDFSSNIWTMGPKYPVHTWPVHYITLDKNSNITSENEFIYLKEEVAYYLEKTCLEDSKMTSSKGITIPQRSGYNFEGYYTEEDGAGTQIIGSDGILTSFAKNDLFFKDTTLYAFWSINHVHDWQYIAKDNSITATCGNEYCYIEEGLTLTLNAPTGSMVYDGNTRAATISSGYDLEAFEAPVIKYFKNNAEVSADNIKTAGNYVAKVTFGQATAQASFEIEKADPTYTAPTGLSATYGDLLYSVALPDGWAWKNASNAVGNAGNAENEAIYTPQDTENYNTLTINLIIDVAKADPIYVVPTIVEAPYGVTLEKVALPAGFNWVDATLDVGTWGEHTFKANYTPSDTSNYNTIENIDIKVVVKWILVDPTQGEVNIIIDDGEMQFDINIKVKVEVKTELSVEEKQTKYASLAKGFIAQDEDISTIYGVKLIRTTNGVEEEIQPSDIKEGQKMQISMAIPEELQGKEFRLLHIHSTEDISEVSKQNYSITADGKNLIIETDKLSEFAFVVKTDSADNGFVYKNSPSIGLIILWIFVAIAVVIFICLLILLLMKKRNGDKNDGQPKVEEIKDEPIKDAVNQKTGIEE